MAEQFHTKCSFENKIMVEYDKRKRTWLQAFARPAMLTGDVTELNKRKVYDFIQQIPRPLPQRLNIWSFGYSCKDLSSLNNHAKAYRDTCL